MLEIGRKSIGGDHCGEPVDGGVEERKKVGRMDLGDLMDVKRRSMSYCSGLMNSHKLSRMTSGIQSMNNKTHSKSKPKLFFNNVSPTFLPPLFHSTTTTMTPPFFMHQYDSPTPSHHPSPSSHSPLPSLSPSIDKIQSTT